MEVWDAGYVLDELLPVANDIRKIIVCGPPKMNQALDQAFEKVLHRLGLESHTIEVI